MEQKFSLEEAIELAKKMGSWNLYPCIIVGLFNVKTKYTSMDFTLDHRLVGLTISKRKFMFAKPKYCLQIKFGIYTFAEYKGPGLKEVYEFAKTNYLENLTKEEEAKVQALRNGLKK